MITTLKITLVRGFYCDHDWSANIELDESSTLEELHVAIQMAIDFDDDHSFSFFYSRTDRSRGREYFHDDDESIVTKKVKDLFPLPERKSLYYLYDWGDEWVFKISPSRKRLHEPVKRVKYPRIESESGVKPVQYPGHEDDDE
ncbi:MAG: hypothetical protein ABL921_10750 [Pirellula sp.]